MWIDADGGRLRVLASGRGSPLLLLHGWALDHRIFAPQFRSFARSFRVVAFDRRGFGRSDAPPDLGRELDDIERILDALGLGTAHLLGMSQGARVALRFAATRPARVRSLLVQAPAIDGVVVEAREAEQIPMREFAELARAGRMDEVRRRWLAHPMMAPDAMRATQRRRLEEIVADYEGRDLLAGSPGGDAFRCDVLAALARLDPECLILTGAYDTAARREHARRLLAALPRAREIVFQRSGHLSNLTETRSYNRHVAEFCGRIDRVTRRQGDAAGDSVRSSRS